VSLIKIFESNKAVVITLLLVAVFMHFEKLAFGDWSYVKLADEGINVLPYHLTDAAALGDKITSFWQPKYAAGVDHLATGTRTGLESFLFSLVPTWLAYGLYKILMFFIGGLFIFKLLHDRLNADYVAAMLAGVAFVTFIPNEIWNKLTVLALPAAVYAIAWRADRKGGVLFAFAAGMIYELGAQVTLSLTLLSTVFFWLYFVERLSLRRAALLFISFAVGIVAAEIHTIWAFIANGEYSHRSIFKVVPPAYGVFFKEWVLSVFNGHALLLGIAALMAWAGNKGFANDGMKRNLTVLAIGAGIALYQPAFEIFRYFVQDISPFIGGYSVPKSYDARIWYALSAGLSLDLILRHDIAFRIFGAVRKYFVAATVFICLALVIAGGVFADKVGRLWDMLYDENFATMYRHPDLLKLAAANKDAPPFRVATPFIISDTGYMVPTFAWAYGFETVDGYVSMYPKRYKEYWLRVLAAQQGNERHREFLGSNSMIYLYGNPTDRGPVCADGGNTCPVEFENDYDLELLSLANVRYFISARRLKSPHLSLLPSATREALIKQQDLRLRQRLTIKLAGGYVGSPLYIYENKMMLPRYFLTEDVKLFAAKDELLLALSEANVTDLRRTAFIRRDDAEKANLADVLAKPQAAGIGPVTVKIVYHERDEIILQIETDHPHVLVAANSYSPFWKADLDGRALTVFPVYNAFQGVLVPKGSYRIRLRYAPPYSPRAYLP
jgi:hypothetical protein